jgi:hypothetical protein
MTKDSEDVATAICMVIDEFGDIDVRSVIVGISAVLTTIVAQTDIPEEVAIEAFTSSLKESRRCIKDISSKAH